MPITIVIMSSDGEYDQSKFVLLDSELLDYLGELNEFPELKSLSDLDPYGDYTFTNEDRSRLLVEVTQIEKRLRELHLPDPPDYVGLEGSDDPTWGEEFGWEGLRRFVEQLRSVLQESSRTDAKVVCVGD